MPNRKKNDTNTGSPQVITTTNMDNIGEQLRLMNQKLDDNKSEITLACAYAKDAKQQATAAKHHMEELSDKPEPYTFKSKGNEKQYQCMMSAINNIIKAMTACEEGIPEEAYHYHKKALARLQERGKCIKIADSHPGGWGLVEEYLMRKQCLTRRKIKKLRLAEISYEAKRKRKTDNTPRGSRANKRGRGSYRGTYQPANTQYYQGYQDYQYSDSYYEQPARRPTRGRARGAHRARAASQGKPASTAPQGEGPCFWCKGPHMRSVCPELAEQAALVQAEIEASYYSY
jgi:hypothetical protein